ncbi:hypothetical protein [Moorena producens]|uniref:hypothetical protein n=1 Tax=Moorena producens TaxID=1155739 RepID=UPI003C70EABD
MAPRSMGNRGHINDSPLLIPIAKIVSGQQSAVSSQLKKNRKHSAVSRQPSAVSLVAQALALALALAFGQTRGAFGHAVRTTL